MTGETGGKSPLSQLSASSIVGSNNGKYAKMDTGKRMWVGTAGSTDERHHQHAHTELLLQ